MITWKPKLAESQSFNSKFFLAENLWSDVSTTLFTDFRRAMENLRDYEVNVWFRKYPYLARIYRGLSICTSSRVCLNCSVNNLSPTQLGAIVHFRITFGLFFKASPGAHLFIWKLFLFACEWKLIFIWKDEHQDSLWKRGQGNSDLSLTAMWLLCVFYSTWYHSVVTWFNKNKKTT